MHELADVFLEYGSMDCSKIRRDTGSEGWAESGDDLAVVACREVETVCQDS